MSNINKQALREAAQEEIMLRSVSDTSDAWQDEASPETVLALLDELEAADAVNKHLELAIRKAEGCSEALRRRAEAAERRIAELEAREVVLPQRHSMLHRDNFDEPYHTEFVYKQHQVLEALHDAGIITKVGE